MAGGSRSVAAAVALVLLLPWRGAASPRFCGVPRKFAFNTHMALADRTDPQSAARFLEFLWCARQEATCTNTGYRWCTERALKGKTCDTLVPVLGSEGVQLRHLCPKTCGLCGQADNASSRPALPAALAQGPCSPGWSHASGSCFLYAAAISNTSAGGWRTWHEAEADCQARGAHLATIRTPAQNHLSLELIRQRPVGLGVAGAVAWIGLWSGPAGCSRGGGAWTWVGGDGDPSQPLYGWHCRGDGAPRCEEGSPAAASASARDYPLSSGEASFAWTDAPVHHSRRAWLCSKPASFVAIASGTCQDHGLSPVLDARVCEAAAGWLLQLSMDRLLAVRYSGPGYPQGCFIVGDSPVVRLSVGTDSKGINSSARFRAVCAGRPASGPSASGAATIGEAATGWRANAYEKVNAVTAFLNETKKIEALLPDPVQVLAGHTVAMVLILGLIPMTVVAAMHGPELPAAAKGSWHFALRCAHQALGRQGAGASLLERAMEARLGERRRTMLLATATIWALHHLMQALGVALQAQSMCKDGLKLENKRILVTLVHLANLWASAAFLVAAKRHRWGRRWFARGLCATSATATLLLLWFEGVQIAARESYFGRLTAGRLLLALCLDPLEGIAFSAAMTLGRCIVYGSVVQDVFLVSDGQVSLLFDHACSRVLDPGTVSKALAAFDVLCDPLQPISSAIPGSLRGLVEGAMQRATSLGSFAVQEGIILAATAVVVVLLTWLMATEITQSIQLLGSEEQLAAVSRILDTLCDATVQLSPDLHVGQPAPRLDVLLHMAPTPGRMLGVDFRSVIATQEQRASFEAQVQSGSMGCQHLGDSLFLNLRCSHSTDLRVQLFATRFRDMAGEVSLLCGVNEVNGDAREPWGPELEGCIPEAPQPQGGQVADRGAGCLRKEACSSHSSDSSGIVVEEDISGGNYAVQLLAEDTRILLVTKAFEEFLGARLDPASGTRMLDILAQPAAFREWKAAKLEGIGSGLLRTPHDTTLPLDLLASVSGPGSPTRPRSVLCAVHFPKMPPDGRTEYIVTLQLLALLRKPGGTPQGSAASRGSRSSGSGKKAKRAKRRPKPDVAAAAKGTPSTALYLELGEGPDGERPGGEGSGGGGGPSASPRGGGAGSKALAL